VLDHATPQYDHEPTSGTQLSVETLTNDGWQCRPAYIADLTRRELWVALDRGLAEPLDPGRSIRLVITHPTRPTQIAETVVLWHLGRTGNVIVLKRPGLWDPPSRRENMRVKLAVPVYIWADVGSEPVPTTSIDIGGGGLFCVAAMDLRIGQRVDLAVQLTPDGTFECQAEVARLDDDPNDPLGLQLMVGFHFLNLDPDERAALVEEVARLAAGADADFVPRAWRPESADVQLHVDIDEPQAGEAETEPGPAETEPEASEGQPADAESEPVTISIELDEQTA
jgi:hypothetical protein